MDGLEFRGTVVSWYPFPIENIHKPGLMPEYFKINNGEFEKKIPGITEIDSVKRRQYINEDQGWAESLVPANELCTSLVNDYLNSCISIDVNAGPGIFWVPGKVNLALLIANKDYKPLLDKHFDRQILWFKALVKTADDSWQEARKHRAITTIQKYAATYLDLDREWLMDREVEDSMSKCEACGTQVPVEGIKCAACGFILNPEKYKAMKERFA